MPPGQSYFRTGDFAARAGVSVRTIRYYDRIGLLKPAAYSASGQRWYTEADYARLRQILTLKRMGLSLEDIRQVLTTHPAALQHLLERQKRLLQAQAQQLLQAVQTIEAAQRSLRTSQPCNLDTFFDMLQVITMTRQTQWLDPFIPAEQQDEIAKRSTAQPLADQRRTGQAWQTLFRDIQAGQNRDVREPAAQALVDRWDDLLLALAPDHPALLAGISEAYSQLDSLPDASRFPLELHDWLRQLQTAAKYVQQARAARSR